MEPPRALLFDVFGTVVDWRSGVAAQCRESFADKAISVDPAHFADLWRAEYQPAMERIRSGERGYVPLDILHRENLDRALEATGLARHYDDHERNRLATAWERLPAWPDVAAGLETIRARAFIAPCSNGSIALMVRLARHAGLPWDTVLGAGIARRYKPEAEVYLASCNALGFEPEQVMMVAAHNDDLEAARDAGLMTAFVARPTEHGPGQKTDLGPASKWDCIASDFMDLATRIG